MLPALALALPAIAWTARLVRGAVADALELPHVEAARLDGLPPRRILLRHALPPALPAIAASIAASCAALAGGSVVVEAAVNYPGVGSVLTQGIQARDVALVSSVVVVMAAIVALAFAVADLVRGPAPARDMDLKRLRRPGALAALIVPAVALLAPLLAPHAEDEVVGAPFATASAGAPLGTDELGRDVLSRFLHGGDELILIAALAAIVGTAGGVLLGLGAAVARPWIGRALERTSEVLLVVPGLLVLILVGASSPDAGPVALVALLAILAVPSVARIMAAAARTTLSTRLRRARHGDGGVDVVDRHPELAPALRGTVLAMLGLRFVEAVYLVAGAAFLGIGPQPPEADWAVMVRENVPGLLLNPWGALAPCAAIALTGIAVGLACDRNTRRPAHA